MASVTPPQAAIHYPERDGKPMGETDTHRQEMMDAIAALIEFFRDRPDVYVAGNLLLYYEEGNPSAVVSPDVFVVFGVPQQLRRTYKLWEEKQPPASVIEITSLSTRLEDLGTKRALYEEIGVGEYFLFDPLDEYLHPPLQGYRLVDGEYVRLTADPSGAFTSEALGLRLLREHNRLRFVDIATGRPLLRPAESYEAHRAEAEAHRTEAEARRAAEERAAAAEADAARLRAELERLRPGGTSATE